MFLSTVKAKNTYYIYLCAYSVKKHYAKNVETVYRFGRKEIAIKKLHHWRENFDSFPNELTNLGLNRFDLEDWIKTLETGITKTGKQFKAII